MNHFDPKTRFQQNALLAGEHRQLAVKSSFVSALDAALLTYQELLTAQATSDIPASAAAFHKIEGARGFIKVLLNLSETISIPARTTVQNLDHKI